MSDEHAQEPSGLMPHAAGAFTAMVTAHAASLERFARGITRTREEAEDALQQGLLNAWQAFETDQAAPRAVDARETRAWLFTIIRHAASRLQRPRAGQPAAMETLEDAERLAADAGFGDLMDPARVVTAMQDVVMVHRCLDALDPTDREIIVLRDMEDLSGAETAALLGIPVATVKTRLHRARLRLAAVVRREVGHGG